MITNSSSPVRPTRLRRFSGSYYFPPPSYRLPISSIRRCRLTLCTPATHLVSRRGTSSAWTFPLPATHQPMSLISLPRSACLLLPPCPMSVRPPFHPQLAPRSLSSLEVLPFVGTSVYLVSQPLPTYVIILLPSSSGVWFMIGWIFARKGEGTGRLYSLAISCTISSL